MCPKDKILLQLIQNIAYKWPCPEENCNLYYTEESSKCLENRVKDTIVMPPVQFTNTVFSTITPGPTSPTSKIIDQNSKQVVREARKAFILESTTLPSTVTQDKCTFQISSTTFLEQMDLPVSLTKW